MNSHFPYAGPPGSLLHFHQFDIGVSRRFDLTAEEVAVALGAAMSLESGFTVDFGRDGWLQVDGPFERLPFAHPTWRAHGRLGRNGVLPARSTRVEIEITSWSDRVSELSLRPVKARPLQWGKRRLDRYCRSAHRAADHLWTLVRSRPVALDVAASPDQASCECSIGQQISIGPSSGADAERRELAAVTGGW
ncbi:MAG: hypothetical protein Q8M22_07290 [Actinomycetota bacterium]|nr:hypothetical protein [Actinomycetota bacterium]